jgi:HEAT repeat protein
MAEFGRSGGPECSDLARFALESALEESDDSIRISAIEALGRLKNRSAIDALTRVIQSDSSSEVRASAKVAIDEIQH